MALTSHDTSFVGERGAKIRVSWGRRAMFVGKEGDGGATSYETSFQAKRG